MQHIYDANNFRKLGHELIDMMADYLSEVTQRIPEQSIPYKKAEEMYDYWLEDWNNDSDSNVISIFSKMITQSIKLHHPRYMGHQVAVVSPVAALASSLASLLNNGQAVYEMGMPGNAMERIICEYMASHIGYKITKFNGFLTSGGTIGTLTALLSARAHYTDVWENGTTEKLAIMVSSEAHYAVDRAARIMGLGSEGVIKIPVDSEYRIDISKLESAWAKVQNNGYKIFALVASICSTSTGSYDDIQSLAKFAQKNKIWLHADGAHGGAVIFSKKYKHLTEGIDLCDSVVIDWHKMLLAPGVITAVLFKRSSDAYHTFNQKAHYLWSNTQNIDWQNSGKRTMECTKLMMSLKVYTMLKAHGKDILGLYVDYTYDLAREFSAYLKTLPYYELAVFPASNIVCFRRIRLENTDVQNDSLNQNIRQKLLEIGKFYIVQTILHGRQYLRVSLMNPFSTIDDLKTLIVEIEKLASE
jgi:L-2,4-diaminobutyrate decarboxylase